MYVVLDDFGCLIVSKAAIQLRAVFCPVLVARQNHDSGKPEPSL
jgi:hypothetical protein